MRVFLYLGVVMSAPSCIISFIKSGTTSDTNQKGFTMFKHYSTTKGQSESLIAMHGDYKCHEFHLTRANETFFLRIAETMQKRYVVVTLSSAKRGHVIIYLNNGKFDGFHVSDRSVMRELNEQLISMTETYNMTRPRVDNGFEVFALSELESYTKAI